jgi:hypothetical protein
MDLLYQSSIIIFYLIKLKINLDKVLKIQFNLQPEYTSYLVGRTIKNFTLGFLKKKKNLNLSIKGNKYAIVLPLPVLSFPKRSSDL